MRVTLRFVLHRELVSITYYIHGDPTFRSESGDENVSTFINYHTNISTIMPGRPCHALQDVTGLQNVHDFLYVTIWKTFFKANPKIPEPSSSWPFPEELKDPEILGNFRGILIVYNHIDFLPLENIVNNPRIIKALLPFLCRMRNANIEDLTVCVMDNQAIYISMLGQLEDDPPHYVLFSNNLSSRKFGELVAHGHRLGILRFASVVPSGKLGEAAHMVSSIGAEIDDALKDNASAKAMQNRIDHINGRFAELDKLFVGGDLRRRLLQSQRYKEGFDALVRSVTISSFENYNSYYDATSKVLSPTLDSIGRLLSDYNYISDKYGNLHQRVSAEHNAEIVDLERGAEFGFFILLGPYYAAMITTHVLGIDEARVPRNLPSWVPLSEQWVFVYCFVGGMCIAGTRAVIRFGRERCAAVMLRMIVVMLMIMVVVLFGACLHVFSVGR